MMFVPAPCWIDTPAAGRLATMRKPAGGLWLKEEMGQLRSKGVDVVVSMLESHESLMFELEEEESACRAHGIRFVSFPVPDFGVPESTDAALELARALAREVLDGRSVLIHCHGGIGRSTLLAAAVLVLLGVGPRQAIDRISAARGFRVPETEEQVEWIRSLAHAPPAG